MKYRYSGIAADGAETTGEERRSLAA